MALKLEGWQAEPAVPQSVLEQVMPTLRTAGIVRSERGPAGSYRLNKAAAEITLERVVRLFQGPLAPIGCATAAQSRALPHDRRVHVARRSGRIRMPRSRCSAASFADLAARAGGPWTNPSLLTVAPVEPAAG